MDVLLRTRTDRADTRYCKDVNARKERAGGWDRITCMFYWLLIFGFYGSDQTVCFIFKLFLECTNLTVFVPSLH